MLCYSHRLIYLWRCLHASHHHASDLQLTEHISIADWQLLAVVRAEADLDRREISTEQPNKVRMRRTMYPVLTVGARYRNNVEEVGQRVGHKRGLYDISVHVDVLDPVKRRGPVRHGLGMSKVPTVEVVNRAVD